MIVADASSIGNAILPDENIDLTDALLQLLDRYKLVQPAHWPMEIANLVTKAARKGRLDTPEQGEARHLLAHFIESAEVEAVSHAMPAYDLSIKLYISTYDAGYLELALRRGMPLLTADGGLKSAARRAGVQLIELT